MPKINSGAYVISNEMLLNKTKFIDLLLFILKLINEGHTDIFFLLEPVVSKVSLYKNTKYFYITLGYGSIVTYNEYLLKYVIENLGMKPYIVVEPFWAKILIPLRKQLYVYTDINYIRNLLENKYSLIINVEPGTSFFKDLSKPCLCIGSLCRNLMIGYGLQSGELTIKHVCGKLYCRDKNNFMVYEVCNELYDACINVYAVNLNSLDKSPFKSLLTIDSLPIILEHVVEPVIVIPLSSYPTGNLKNVMDVIVIKSVLYLISNVKG